MFTPATQLFEEAKKYLPAHVELAFISSSVRVGDIASANVIIGTHALLYEKLENVSLVMVDEQHRFGTAQRNALKNFGDNPHFLQFSATPIPRTLGMINATLVDYSFIKELPFEKNIKTKVVHKENFGELLAHIKEEIALKHQIAIIYPKVEQSDSNEYQSLQEARGFWESRFDGVFVTHGKDKEKEEVLKEFAKTGNILLATTVVEVGISLPRLTIVKIGRAHV